ncbi:hypothetical protein IW139_005291, partial [Coemansia sp. RSA 353]
MYARALLSKPVQSRLPVLFTKPALSLRVLDRPIVAMSTAAAATTALPHSSVLHPLTGRAVAGPARGIPDSRLYPYYVAYTEEGTVRVDVRKSPQLLGQTSSRGTRGYNQDRAEFIPLRIPGMVADRKDLSSAQIMYLGTYDG